MMGMLKRKLREVGLSVSFVALFFLMQLMLTKDRVLNEMYERLSDERGQILEYVLLALLIAVACILAIGLFSGALQDAFQRLANSVRGVR